MKKAYSVSTYQPIDIVEKKCAVCNISTETSLVAYENSLNIVTCNQCGFTFVNPRPSQSELNRFYQDYYPDSMGIPESWNSEMGDIFTESQGIITDRKTCGSILDIGCSYGFFLDGFSAESWHRCGVEPSQVATDYLKDTFQNVDVVTSTFESVEYPAGSFDVVTAFYVLEHVIDPREFMEKVYAVLKDDGIAIIRIPYTKPFFGVSKLLNRPLMQAPMHLSDFSPENMISMCSEIGFSEVNTFNGAHRYSVDFVEKVGATVMSAAGRFVEIASAGKVNFPFYGAYSYLISK
ncbi:MAG: SAM-dependent methyltransferase [Paraglaciecola sp.]|jgi:SAM-dependent methyltransferase